MLSRSAPLQIEEEPCDGLIEGKPLTALQIIASCTSRKRLPVPAHLRLRELSPDLPIEERAHRWTERLANDPGPLTAAADLYGGDYWAIVQTLTGIAERKGFSARLWVASAGYGLVPATAQLHPYSATFTAGDPDAIAMSGESGDAARNWWSALAAWPGAGGEGPRSVAALASADPAARILVIASPEYINALRDDITAAAQELADPNHLLIVSSPEGLARSSLAAYLVPSTARWQSTLGGARVSLHARVARHVLTGVDGADLRADKQRARIERETEALPPLATIARASVSDDEVRAFIREHIGNTPAATASRLLRAFRDGGYSCERVRFAKLFGGIAAERPAQPPSQKPAAAQRVPPRANHKVDYVIKLPGGWQERSQARPLRFFLPEWDDRVDPDYDFVQDRHHSGVGDWANEVYAHQMYPAPNYDGLLVSKVVAEESSRKKELINQLGVHRFLRVPAEFPILGDCGAFGYIKEEVPPYSTGEILDYYTRLGFTYGVSIDHLIVGGTEREMRFRYDLTIDNAEAFLREHRTRRLDWTPIGAVQGWDPGSYADAARQYVAMGYRYIALGGLVRTKTPQILRILEAVKAVVPDDIDLHLFGIARIDGLQEFSRLGVTSVDGTSMLRKAWLGSDWNYLTPDGWYAAIRVPQAKASFRAKRLIRDERRTLSELERLEAACLNGLREYDRSSGKPSVELLDHLIEYDTLVAGERPHTKERLRRTLEDRPWAACDCAICRTCGIEVVIFRGNNRNRRRGFHNTYVFNQLLDRLFSGEDIHWLPSAVASARAKLQLPLLDVAD